MVQYKTHRVTVDENSYGNGVNEYQAFCEECSWSSKPYNNKEDGGDRKAKRFAKDEGYQHTANTAWE